MWICTGSSAALVQSSHTRTNHRSRKCLSWIQQRQSEVTVFSIFFRNTCGIKQLFALNFQWYWNCRLLEFINKNSLPLKRKGRERIQLLPDKMKQRDLGWKTSSWGIPVVLLLYFHLLLHMKSLLAKYEMELLPLSDGRGSDLSILQSVWIIQFGSAKPKVT